jgi:GT2 family glycosyltransferase
MNKFSVIIPTLWKSGRTRKLLEDLNDSEYVGEIIIIDNSRDNRIIYLDKVKVYNQLENIYVNPAWNLGVSLSKYENLLLCNDDINFDTKVLEYLLSVIDDIGVIGQSSSNYVNFIKDKPNVIPFTKRPHGWGCLICIKKNKWLDIPNELKIACGDDYLINNVKGGAYSLTNVNIFTEMSTTSSSSIELINIQLNDIKIYKSKYENK